MSAKGIMSPCLMHASEGTGALRVSQGAVFKIWPRGHS